jgi:hypothetical protein
VTCGIPLDAQYFDDSSIVDLQAEPDEYRTIVLAQFDLPPQYCGVLQNFFQFTDLLASDPTRIDTPGLAWVIRVNGHPLHPYLGFQHIVNPWGSWSCQVAIRLDEGARLDLAVRRLGESPGVRRIGARIAGRYWYNTAYGTVA